MERSRQVIGNSHYSWTCRLFSRCFNVQMCSWSGTSLLVQWCYYGRRYLRLNTRSYENMDLCVPRCTKDPFKRCYHMKKVCCGITCLISWKNLALLMYLIKSDFRFIVLLNMFSYIRAYLSINLHTILIHLIYLTISYLYCIFRVCTKGVFLHCVVEWFISFLWHDFYVTSIWNCQLVFCDKMLCFRRRTVSLIVIPCINIFEINDKMELNYQYSFLCSLIYIHQYFHQYLFQKLPFPTVYWLHMGRI